MESASLEIAGGAGLTLVKPAGYAVSGDGVRVDPTTYRLNTTGAGTQYVVFRLTVSPDASLGPRSLYAAVGEERAVFTGVIDVVAPGSG